MLSLAKISSDIPWINDDILFIIWQKDRFEFELENLISEKEKLKMKIKKVSDVWKDIMLNYEKNKWKSSLKEKYEKIKLKNEKLNRKLNNIISEYWNLFIKLHDFIYKYFPKNSYSWNFPILSKETQLLRMQHPVSEWQIISVRIICIILLNLFSQSIKWRIPNFLFFDSMVEKISEFDWNNWLFNLINNFIKDFQNFPQTFLFISWKYKEDRFNLRKFDNFSIFDLSNNNLKV